MINTEKELGIEIKIKIIDENNYRNRRKWK